MDIKLTDSGGCTLPPGSEASEKRRRELLPPWVSQRHFPALTTAGKILWVKPEEQFYSLKNAPKVYLQKILTSKVIFILSTASCLYHQGHMGLNFQGPKGDKVRLLI